MVINIMETPPIAQEKVGLVTPPILREGYGNMRRVLRESEPSGNAGEIKEALRSLESGPIIVGTDSGTIAPKEREILTERLSGCIALFIQGPGFNYLVHMTPGGWLGYYYHRFNNSQELVANAVRKIMNKIPKDIPPADLSAHIIANMPEETDSTYGRSKLMAAWQGLEHTLQEAGITNTKVVEVPLDETLIYFLPATPDVLYAVGNPVEIKEDGSYRFHPTEVADQTISLRE